MRSKGQGFTLIELIMTIVVLAIVMIPLGFMSMEYMQAIVHSRGLAVAEGLVKTEMAKINNLSYSDSTLEDGDDDTTSNYEGHSYDLRRTVDYVVGSSNNLKKVQVRVYPPGNTTDHLVNLVTYIANVSFGSGSGGGAASSEADSLVVSSGNIHRKVLRQIDMENSNLTDDITIDQVTVSWGGSNTLTEIEIGGSTRWTGSESTSGTTIDITDFTLTAGTSYNNTGLFTFSSNVSSVSLTFIMSDASETSTYSW